MRAKKLSRAIGFAFVVAIMGGVGATAWAGTDEPVPTPAPAPTVVESPPVQSPSPSAPAAPRVPKAPPRDVVWI
jgi:hypothetical protein